MNDIFVACFGSIKDPRVNRTKKHLLIDIIALSIMATLSGHTTYEEMHLFGLSHYHWLKTKLLLPNAIPSADTFRRLFNAIDNVGFQRSSVEFLRRLSMLLKGNDIDVVSLDGKSMRGSKEPSKNKSALHVLNAFSSKNKIALGQLVVDNKSNEATMLPLFLNLLDITGSIVTIDAAGCYKNVVEIIAEKKADFVIALKDNQPAMFNLAKESFQLFDQGESDIRVHTAEDEIDSGHGRIDKRLVHTMSADKLLPYIDKAWKGIESLARITHVEWKNGQESISYRFYITSLKAGSPTLILNSIRAHWLIENNLHWALDVSMGEDASRIRHRNGALNASWLRKLVLGILKNASFDIPKLSIKSKQLLIASNPSCRIPMVLEAF